METRDQKYAKAAFPMVQEKKAHKKANDKETAESIKLEKGYRTLALNFPVMILQSGLTQATGFLLAKAKDGNEHQKYLNDLAGILGQNTGALLHESVIKSNLVQYQQLTRKALEASAWLKRYTQALLEAEPKL